MPSREHKKRANPLKIAPTHSRDRPRSNLDLAIGHIAKASRESPSWTGHQNPRSEMATVFLQTLCCAKQSENTSNEGETRQGLPRSATALVRNSSLKICVHLCPSVVKNAEIMAEVISHVWNVKFRYEIAPKKSNLPVRRGK
jgi:hypothetical protein